MSVEFGKLMRAAREQRGLSLRQMGKVMGIDHAFVARIETGEKHASLRQAYDWSRYLGEDRRVWVRAVLQDMLSRERIAMTVELKP